MIIPLNHREPTLPATPETDAVLAVLPGEGGGTFEVRAEAGGYVVRHSFGGEAIDMPVSERQADAWVRLAAFRDERGAGA